MTEYSFWSKLEEHNRAALHAIIHTRSWTHTCKQCIRRAALDDLISLIRTCFRISCMCWTSFGLRLCCVHVQTHTFRARNILLETICSKRLRENHRDRFDL